MQSRFEGTLTMPSNISELAPIAQQSVSVSTSAAVPEQGFTFQPLLYLRCHPKIAIATFLAVLIGGALFLHGYLHPSYSAESVVYVSPTFPHELTDDHEHDLRSYDEFIEQQIYGVTRYANMKQAIEKNPNVWMMPGEREEDAIARLQKALKVAQMGHSYQVSIGLQSGSPEGLAEFVNTITAGYIQGAHNDEFFGRDERIATLTKERLEISSALEADLRKQTALLSGMGIAQLDPKGNSNPYDAVSSKLRDQLADAHEKRAEAEVQAQVAKGTSGPNGSTALQNLAASQLNLDPAMATMQTQLTSRRAQLILQMNGLTPQNPLFIQAQAEMKEIDKQLDSMTAEATNRVAGQIQNRYAAERDQAARLESQLTTDLSHTTAQAIQAAPKLQQAQIINDEIQRFQASYALVDTRINQLDLEGNSPGSEHVVSWATPPMEAVPKHAVLFMVCLGIGSIVAAILAAFLANLLDPHVYTAGDIRQLLGFSPIGLLLHEDDFSSTMRSEYLLRLAAGIDQAHRRAGARTFVFTSAGSGNTREIVRHLGVDLAGIGLTTLVVLVGDPEAEVEEKHDTPPNSRFSTQLTSSRSWQRKDLSLEPAMDQEVAPPLLQVVTKSPQSIPDFLRRSRTSFNTILVGADPILLSAHSEHFARIADGTVLVAESGQVTKKQVKRVAKLLERLKISGIAVVLSQIRKERADTDVIENMAEYAQSVPVQS